MAIMPISRHLNPSYPEFGHPTNAQLVERVVQMANSMGREISTAAEVRALFGFAAS